MYPVTRLFPTRTSSLPSSKFQSLASTNNTTQPALRLDQNTAVSFPTRKSSLPLPISKFYSAPIRSDGVALAASLPENCQFFDHLNKVSMLFVSRGPNQFLCKIDGQWWALTANMDANMEWLYRYGVKKPYPFPSCEAIDEESQVADRGQNASVYTPQEADKAYMAITGDDLDKAFG
ncbi:hypothetical protein B7494_g326 [Chlorociboria aeruginascens]|nr:hypothetical protein B7494_g326 [Chlorociboria aeruginascens]